MHACELTDLIICSLGKLNVKIITKLYTFEWLFITQNLKIVPLLVLILVFFYIGDFIFYIFTLDVG